MAVFVLEDLEAAIEVTIFPRTLTEQGHKLEDDLIVTVKGRLDRRDESRFGLIGQTITVLTGLSDGPAPALRLRLPSTSLDELRIQRLKRILREHPGDSLVMVDVGQGRVLSCPTSSGSTSIARSVNCGWPSATKPCCSSCLEPHGDRRHDDRGRPRVRTR